MKTAVLFLNGMSNWELAVIISVISLTVMAGVMLFIIGRYVMYKENRLNETIRLETQFLSEEVKRLSVDSKRCEMLSSVALNTQNGVIIADAEGEIIWINRGFRQMTGYDLEGLKKNRGDTLIAASCCPNIELIINQALRMMQSIRYETYTYNKRGKKLWVSSLITPVFDEDSNLKQFVIIDADITELKQMKAEIGMSNTAVMEIKEVII